MKVSAIWVYPIKSCRGVALTSARLLKEGLQFDRQWVVVRADTGKFLTQRQKSNMCKIGVALDDAALEVSAPGKAPLRVKLALSEPLSLRKVTVWEYTGMGADEGDEAAAWFSDFLGLPCRLVRYVGAAADSKRTTEPQYAVGFEVRFADGYPMLLATEESLADLNAKMDKAVPMNRFRPNIVLSGAEGPWVEDTWRRLAISTAEGPLEVSAVKPCSRCNVPTIDQDTGEEGDEPSDTLNKIRTGQVLGWAEYDKSTKWAVYFGWNCVSNATGTIAVGDEVTVAQAGPPTQLEAVAAA